MVASFINQGSHLFGRLYSLAIYNNDGVASIWGNEEPGQSPLKLKFQVERPATGPADAKLSLCNLTADSRNAIRTGTQIVLRAGYQGSMARVFDGVVKKMKTSRNGPDIETEIEATDGLNFTNYAVIHQSYAAGTPLFRIFEDIAKAMRLDISNEPTLVKNNVVAGIPDETLGRGRVIDGPVRKVLTELCRPRDLVWSVQNQRLVVLPRTHYNCAPVVILSRETGLINVPSFNTDLLSFNALLIPGLTPGCVVQIRAQNDALSGNYLVTKYKAEGDTHGPQWDIECEGTRYMGTLNAIPINRGDDFSSAVQ